MPDEHGLPVSQRRCFTGGRDGAVVSAVARGCFRGGGGPRCRRREPFGSEVLRVPGLGGVDCLSGGWSGREQCGSASLCVLRCAGKLSLLPAPAVSAICGPAGADVNQEPFPYI